LQSTYGTGSFGTRGNLSANAVRVSEFARENAVFRADEGGVGASASFEKDIPEYDDDAADLDLDDLF
jgi:hypothetical protein